jgi:hypothetical protein
MCVRATTRFRGVRHLKWFSAAIILAIPLVIGAQQQPNNRRAGWPCGARLDPSYFRMTEGTGGHLLLLSPEEITDSAELLTSFGAHPETILRLAGSMSPGLHEFHVPIDSSVESAVFSISVQCLQAADVMRPSGAFVSGDDVTDLSNFRAQRMVVVKRPEPGRWTVRVAGSGVSAVVVQAQSEIGIGQIEFAPAKGTIFSPVPAIGENIVRIRMSGPVTALHASVVSGSFVPYADLPLSAAETERTYVSRFTPSAEGFRVLVGGIDAQGLPFQRVQAPLLTPIR